MSPKDDGKDEREDFSFNDLLRDVHDTGLCGQCGGCVAFCSAGDLNALALDPSGTPYYLNEDECLHCGICYLICPNSHILDEDIKKEFNWKPPLGTFKDIYSARSTDPKILENCTDGGVVTSILTHLIQKNLIDGAIVSRRSGPFMSEPFIATSYQDLLLSAGSRFKYNQEKSMDELGRFSTYSSTIPTMKGASGSDMLRLAYVGTPCQVETIRKMQYLKITPAHTVKFIIGLFCSGMFSFEKLAKKRLEKKFGITFESIKKVNIKENLLITTVDDEVISIHLDELDDFIRPACLVCEHYANDFADISVGGIGSPEGYTTVLIRTDDGEMRFKEALNAGAIELLEHKTSESRKIARSKMLGELISMAKRKMKRGSEAFEELLHMKRLKGKWEKDE